MISLMNAFNQDSHLKWRPATAADLEIIRSIGNAIFALPERPEVYAEKFNLFSEGCFVLVQNERVVGYGFSHPWLLQNIPPLDTFLGELPRSPECLFIHAVAVLPEARGYGAAGVLVESIAKLARERGIVCLGLVSVCNTHLLWARFGFEVVTNAKLSDTLKTYGETARYMIRKLG
jgi:GNAT superfamily N-acetyltransferase